MGLNRGSLYGTFGDKKQLFLAALDRYEAQRGDELRKMLEKQEMMVGGGRAINVTASFGVATMDDKFQPADGAQLVKMADDSVYAAKRAGRNRVVAHEP